MPLLLLVPLPIAVKGHILRTCVSGRSCILVVNLPSDDMARSTAALVGPYSRNCARTCHTFTHFACALSGAKASHILDIYTLANCFTMCS